jgi:hypothetical protein
MSLESRLAELITSLGTDWKNVWAKIGSGALTTTSTNLIGAINEVKATADAGGVGTATTTVAGKSELADDTEALAMSAADRVLTPHNIGSIVNVNNGLVKLDSGGKVASAQLPAFVDDVLEYANLAAFPGSGTTGIIYVALDTNKTYRWGGSSYTEISPSPGSTDAVTEGSTNLYFTNARADTRADSRITARIGDETTDLVALYTAAKA